MINSLCDYCIQKKRVVREVIYIFGSWNIEFISAYIHGDQKSNTSSIEFAYYVWLLIHKHLVNTPLDLILFMKRLMQNRFK